MNRQIPYCENCGASNITPVTAPRSCHHGTITLCLRCAQNIMDSDTLCHACVCALDDEAQQEPVTQDANLIAAAPELLECCRLAIDEIYHIDAAWAVHVRVRLREAIAKAEGKESND